MLYWVLPSVRPIFLLLVLITITESADINGYMNQGIEPVFILIRVIPIKYRYCLVPPGEHYPWA